MSYLFMIVVSIYALFIGNKYFKPYFKVYKYQIFVGLICLSTFLFFLIEILTFKPRPSGATSGNGNPILLISFVLTPAFFLLLYLWVKGVSKGFIKQLQSDINKHLLTGTSLLVMGCVLQVMYIRNKLNLLENHPYNPFDAAYRGSIINQYTNNWFFNGNVFGIFIAGTLVGTLLNLKFKKLTKND